MIWVLLDYFRGRSLIITRGGLLISGAVIESGPLLIRVAHNEVFLEKLTSLGGLIFHLGYN